MEDNEGVPKDLYFKAKRLARDLAMWWIGKKP